MKFIKFEKKVYKMNTENTLDVFNHKNEYLGYISYMGEWKKHKQWIFNTSDDTFFTVDCLLEIAEKIKELNKNIK